MDARPHENALDWLRGLAALAILVFHLTPFITTTSLVPRAYLAVDLFFLISGFVVARNYQPRLERGLSMRAFFAARLLRLAPLLVLAALVASAEMLLRRAFGSTLSDVPWFRLAIAALTSAAALPSPAQPQLGLGNWPLDPPLWSLFFELIVGVALAPLLFKLRGTALAMLACVLAVLLAWVGVARGNLNGGVFLGEAPVALARIAFSFCLGVIVHRVRIGSLPRMAVVWPCATGLACGALLMLAGGRPVDVAIDPLTVFVAWPLLLRWALGPGARRIPRALVLGELSYALYVLHWPVMFLARNIARHLGWMGADSIASTAALGVAGLVVSIVAVLGWERPLRRRLRPASPAPA